MTTRGGKTARNLAILAEAQGVAGSTPTCAKRVLGNACPICDPYDLGTWRWSHPDDVLSGSIRTRRITGLPCEGESRSSFLARVDDADRPDVATRLAAAVASAQPFETEFRIEVAGDLRHVRMHGYVDAETDAVEPQFFGTIEDVTARHYTTQALIELSLAVEQSHDHICITDANGTIEYVNRAWRESLGRERPMTSLPVAILLGDPRIWTEGRSAIARGEVFRKTVSKTNGTVSYREFTMWPIRDQHGQLVRIVVVSSDAGAQVRAEETEARVQNAIRDAAHEWRRTVDAIDAAIVMFDPPATIRRMNRAARDLLGGQDYDRFIGRTLDPQTLSEPWPTIIKLVTEASERGLSFQRQVHDNATGHSWHIVGSVSDGSAIRDVVVIIRDITDTLALQESIRRSEVMSAMGNLVAGVAHEVKNPLFGLTATLDAMELKFRSSPDAIRYTSMMRREVGRLNTLMRDLLDYGRSTKPELQPVMIGSIVASAVRLCRESAARRDVTIANHLPAEWGAARGDFASLEQVFRNILDNAISFSSSGQTIAITGDYMPGEALRIEVCDEGPGFAPDDLARVFEPFFTRRKGGTGLGLSIVRRTVEEHGGHVSATNRSPAGAMVRIELPARC